MKVGAPVDLKTNHRNLPICGVVASAVSTNQPIGKVYSDLAASKRGNWRGRLQIDEILQYIRRQGVELFIAYDLSEYEKDKRTLKSLIQRTMITEPETAFLVFTTGHVQVVQGRNCIDQAGVQDFMDYRWNRKKIDFDIYRIDTKRTINEVSRQEIVQMVTKKETKFSRATKIVIECKNDDVPRKDILARLTAELDTTWGTSSTFYHRVMREIKQKEVA